MIDFDFQHANYPKFPFPQLAVDDNKNLFVDLILLQQPEVRSFSSDQHGIHGVCVFTIQGSKKY